MDYASLKAVDPGGDLASAVATLVAQTVTVAVDVPISTVAGYMLVNGIVAAADAWATAHADDTTGVLGVIRSLEGLLASPHLSVVEMSDAGIAAAVTSMLGALVSAEIMSGAQQAAILAMSSATVPKWPGLTAGDIQTARAQP
jgi:hypothetical protein